MLYGIELKELPPQIGDGKYAVVIRSTLNYLTNDGRVYRWSQMQNPHIEFDTDEEAQAWADKYNQLKIAP